MVALPLFIFTKSVALKRDVEARQKMKWGMVVGYLIGLFTLISGILFNIVRGLFAVLGVGAFIGTAVVALAYYAVKDQSRRNEQRRRRALAWALKDELEQLKEELSRGVITPEKYEQEKKSLEDQLDQLKAPDVI
jgi:membrane protein required for beta-lactamase induction